MHLILIQSIIPKKSNLFSNCMYTFILLMWLFHYFPIFFTIIDNQKLWSYFDYYS
jgi:hypothetical protein